MAEGVRAVAARLAAYAGSYRLRPRPFIGDSRGDDVPGSVADPLCGQPWPALGFYRDLVGFTVTWRFPPEGERERMAQLRDPDGNRVVVLSRL